MTTTDLSERQKPDGTIRKLTSAFNDALERLKKAQQRINELEAQQAKAAKELENAQEQARDIGQQHYRDINNIREHCEDILHYIFWKITLSKEDSDYVMELFRRIFGRKLKKPSLPVIWPPINEFPWEVAKQYANFLAPGNIKDDNKNIVVKARIRPFTDEETATEEKNTLSYNVTSSKILSFGKYETAQNFHIAQIFPARTSQQMLKEGLKEVINMSALNLKITYGQSGSGKTYSTFGGVWEGNGIVQLFLADLAKEYAKFYQTEEARLKNW